MKTTQVNPPPGRLSALFLVPLALVALTPNLARAQATPAAPAPSAATLAKEKQAAGAVSTAPGTSTAANEETVQLSPFEVSEANNGYYASNTMSGTRLNSKIEDLGSAISVVTKAQMSDFAMLDINDIFNYETSTEGTGNFTDFSIDRNGMVADNIQNNPQGANRIRGIGAANIALNNFANSGRVPVDPIAIDGVEISRGPNSNIFGLGQGSGTVNLLAASASLNKQSTTAEFRVDNVGGYRTSLDLNRPLIRSKLAARGSFVFQHDGFNEKPAGATTRRLNSWSARNRSNPRRSARRSKFTISTARARAASHRATS